jgi:DNA-binding IclR family transcriptional regulator
MPSEADKNLNRTTLRVFAILDLLARAGSTGMRLTDLSSELAAHKSTTSRILAALQELRVVEQGPGGRFHLGISMLRLGLAVYQNLDLRARSIESLRRLAAETGETVHMGVPDGSSVIYVEKLEGTNAYQMRSRIGMSMPMHSTGLGKAILAFLAPDPRELFGGSLERRTPHTITDFGELERELGRTRRRGFSTDLEENEAGVSCVGAPVFNHEGAVVAGISIAGPTFQLDEKRMSQLAAATVAAARAVSVDLGWSPAAVESDRPVGDVAKPTPS